jgi:hypothetical protein
MAIGYFVNKAEAESYFANERLETASWDALSNGGGAVKDEKTAVLTQAFNTIFYSQEFILPLYAAATADQLTALRRAQAEMAYYLAEHGADQDTRKGLQIQGVAAAGAVKETYDASRVDKTPIPPAVRDLLQGWWTGTDVPFHAVDIDRDEDYGVEEDVTDHL